MSLHCSFVTACPLLILPENHKHHSHFSSSFHGTNVSSDHLLNERVSSAPSNSTIRADVERPFERLNLKWLRQLRPLHRRRLFSFGGEGRDIRTDKEHIDEEGEVRMVYGENEPYPGLPTLDEYVDEKGLPFDKKDWAGMYRTCMEERDMWISKSMIEGVIPKDLVGTMFRNIPAGLHAGNYRFKHMFDGDGMICRVVFDEYGRVRWTNRYVRTEGFIRERREQDVVYRSTFGRDRDDKVNTPLGRFQYKNVGNTNVVYWGEKLLALWENGLPHRLDPFTLDTMGLDKLCGKFRNGITFTTGVDFVDEVLRLGDSFTAHPYVYDGRLIGFNYTPMSDGRTKLSFYEFDDRWNLVSKAKATLPGFTFVHDFSITENYYVVLMNGLTIERLPLILGQKTPGECIRLAKDVNVRIVLVPRRKHSKKEVKIFETDARVCFHHINAYEKADGSILLNTVVQSGRSDLDVFSDFRFPNINFQRTGVSNLTKFHIRPDQDGPIRAETLRPHHVEFCVMNPSYIGKKHRYVWMCESLPLSDSDSSTRYVGSPMQVHSKIDLETGEVRQWFAGQRSFVNEPVFVPKQNALEEDAGYLIGFIYDAGRKDGPGNDIVILDAQFPERGPLATIHLPLGLPPGLHASFVPQIFSRSYEDN